MSNTILHKRNNYAGVVPTPQSIYVGEIAINTVDGKFFIKTPSEQIITFLSNDYYPYILETSLSSVNVNFSNNIVTGILGSVLGGVDNNVSGAGSSIINGSDNTVSADYAIITNGENNNISVNSDYSSILGGKNNNLNHQESFILGSNITSHLSGFTYVNNLSVLGKVYGDGSELTGVAGGGSYLPLAGGDLTGAVTSTSTISSSDIVYASGERVVTGESTDATPVHKIRAMSQATYDALGTYDPNTIYFITQ